MEDKDKRQGWLRELKVGDKVIVVTDYNKSVKIVDKITPTGRIKIGNTTFDHNGYEIGSGWRRDILREWTQEGENELNKQEKRVKMYQYLRNYDWKKCQYDLLESIYNQINNEESK